MRRIIGLMIALIVISCTEKPQNSLSLQIHYKPGVFYNFNSEQTIHTIVKYTGKEKILQTLKSRGISNPTVINKKSIIDAGIKTGPLEDDHSFTISVDYKSTMNDKGEDGIPLMAKIHGKCYKDSIPVFDVFVADHEDVNSKVKLLESWNRIFTQQSFPGENLKPGQVLITQNPMVIPMEGSEIDVVAETTYQLIAVKDGKANFKISQQYTLTPQLMDNSFTGEIKGEGEMVYSIVNSIVEHYSLNTEMKLTKVLDSFEFELTTTSTIRQTMKVVDN